MRFLWDQHACPDISPTASLEALLRYPRPAAISLNVGYAPHDLSTSIAVLRAHRDEIARQDDAILAFTVSDIDAAIGRGQHAIWFDLEDANPLDGDINAISLFAELGVKSMLTTYNTRNSAGCGCMDIDDDGLTAYGRDIVREMNRVGMVVDAAHVSARSLLDLVALSVDPVIVSHTAARTLNPGSARCITDDQARAIADTGGVIGICGIGVFLGDNDASVPNFVRHIEHLANVVGIEHIGIGSDFSFNLDEVNDEVKRNPALFPPEVLAAGEVRMTPPEEVATIGDTLLASGWPLSDVVAVEAQNFRRIAREVWK